MKFVNPKLYRKSESRTEAWVRLCIEALDALSDLESLRSEYEEILDNVPENLLSTRYAEKLQEVLDIDIEGALDIINEANCLELPLGFGRD